MSVIGVNLMTSQLAVKSSHFELYIYFIFNLYQHRIKKLCITPIYGIVFREPPCMQLAELHLNTHGAASSSALDVI